MLREARGLGVVGVMACVCAAGCSRKDSKQCSATLQAARTEAQQRNFSAARTKAQLAHEHCDKQLALRLDSEITALRGQATKEQEQARKEAAEKIDTFRKAVAAQLRYFVDLVTKHRDHPERADLGEPECLPPNAKLMGSPDPEAGYCALMKIPRDGWDPITLDYKKRKPRIATFGFSVDVGLKSPEALRLTCRDFEHAQQRRRWKWGGINTWCSLADGPLKGWELRLKEAEVGGGTYLWLTSPEWMADGGPHGTAWKNLKTQGQTIP